jgi:hypothetical protein
MTSRRDNIARQNSTKRAASSRRVLVWWFGLMALGGAAFGLQAERRPFGDAMLAHPITVFFLLVGAALLVLRVASRRPVPEMLPERVLLAGCLLGVAAFLAGNWFDAHIVSARW